ncbi:formate C-acetyltransferase [Sporobacter termitidis DSM 10068]|uniref:Formate C-acetyltransferase n=1 Tax=Sporobacter termitidis DSM 10068 TaxID=1123282 RepID=A0A1M5Y7H2_9FIRM|nr:pyruvate formate lyase family protein [Sporobacter termitidis]SHI07758.1 formate C-acetyltransferase [Sporobacter termitidis DSM 10068]
MSTTTSAVTLTSEENVRLNRDTYKNACLVDAHPQAVEPFDKEWGVGISGNTPEPSPFERINNILAITQKTTNGFVSPDRAELVTEAYKAHPGEPQILKSAYGIANVLDKTPIYIFPHELIVGCLGCDKKGGPVHPEFGLNWVVDEMRDGLMGYSEQRTHDYFTYTKDTQDRLEALRGFWDGKTVEDMTNALLDDDVLKGSHAGKGVFFADAYIFCGAGHLGLDYERLFRLGFKGIRELIVKQMDALSVANPEDLKKRTFYKATLITTEAAIRHIRRYAALAGEMAEGETDVGRQAELRKTAEICAWIAENPPRTFWEAIQLVNLANTLIHIECNGHSVSYGRFDQYMYPYYLHDLETGEATREFMQELIENFYIKIWDLNKLRNHILIKTFGNGGIGGPSLTVGGIKKDGSDGTNDLTFMALDAHAHVRVPNPWLAVRMHANTPWELKVKTANLIRMGTGEPKIFNDDVAIPSMLTSNVALMDARDYQVVGCVEPDVSGKSYGWKDCGHMNIARVLELAINDGRCYNCSPSCPRYSKCAGAGSQLGLKTGSLADFTSFDQVLDAYDKQMAYWCERQVALLNAVDLSHQELRPLPFLSILMDGCIENGKDVTAGGTKYNFTGPQGVGIGTAGDGLATIKQLVFDEKRVTGRELLDAVKANWEGHEDLYAYVNSDRVHHYGNDDDYADQLAKFAMDTWCKHIERKPNAHGGFFQPGAYSVTVNVAHGQNQWASVEGRKAFEPVSDCMGAVHTKCCSHDIKGPIAICKSVTKLDHARATNGTLLNWKFSPSTLVGETGRDNFIALMDEYIHRKGMHSQFTVANQETLIAAQKDPDNYRDLLVRVAGYSAYFVELGKALQDDIIGRTELSFD